MAVDSKKFAKEVGGTIAFYRQQAGFTQEQVAEKLGIGNEAVSRIERGIAIPTVIRLVEFAEIFDCNVADLLVRNSQREQDQADYLSQLLKQIGAEDRELVVALAEKLVAHLAKR